MFRRRPATDAVFRLSPARRGPLYPLTMHIGCSTGRALRLGLTLASLVVGFASGASADTRRPATARADDDSPGMFFEAIPLPAGCTREAVREAGLAAFHARHWEVLKVEGGRIVAYLNSGRYEARTTFLYSEQEVRVYSTGFFIDRSGVRARPHIPVKWLEYLKQDLRIALGVDPDTGGTITAGKLARYRAALEKRTAEHPSAE